MNKLRILAFVLTLGVSGLFYSGEAMAAGNNVVMTGVVNLNTASQLELMQLPGIGAKKAEDIIAYRQKREFKKVNELMRIKGFGRKMYDRLADYLTVSEPTKLTIIRKTN